jgi:aminopeptidase N
MDSWISRKGFPVVTITRNTGSNKLTVKQELFLKDYPTSDSKYKTFKVNEYSVLKLFPNFLFLKL